MIQVRHNLFETNSSSTHSLVITTKDEWKKFTNREMLIDLYSGELIPITDKNKDNYPHKRNDRKWEFKGVIYNELFDIETADYSWYDMDHLLYDAFNELSVSTIKKELDNGQLAVAIYASTD